nr:Lipase, member I [Mus musculus]AAI47405.1 Lipase, member I [Mus musculus]BAC37507.1 unnamed protein product [Mus musculus]
MRNGSISFGLLNDLGDLEYSTLYEKSKPFDNLQEVKILVQFVNDIVSISRICLTYFQSTNPYCAACQYKIQSLVLKSLTYPERPPICKYNFVLKEGTRVDLQPDECNTQME